MIHHITAICASAQTTANFYTRVLGLRLVKLTVNQDDVGTYHLYFGDRIGAPGTVLTFFPWAHLPRGSVGAGGVSEIAFAVPPGSLNYWQNRLSLNGVESTLGMRHNLPLINCKDPDGLELLFVEQVGEGSWTREVPTSNAIHRFYGVTLVLHHAIRTVALLKEHFGYTPIAGTVDGIRMIGEDGSIIYIVEDANAAVAVQGLGSVHHIAFRTKDNESQIKLRAAIAQDYLRLTPVIDRYYFSSVYFREPGGILFEIATDGPGFTVDEREEILGTSLMLPPAFESSRAKIIALLPAFTFSK